MKKKLSWFCRSTLISNPTILFLQGKTLKNSKNWILCKFCKRQKRKDYEDYEYDYDDDDVQLHEKWKIVEKISLMRNEMISSKNHNPTYTKHI
jgi:3-phenylpropionate/cinnamic acid dioxygenase small subunit